MEALTDQIISPKNGIVPGQNELTAKMMESMGKDGKNCSKKYVKNLERKKLYRKIRELEYLYQYRKKETVTAAEV